MDSLKIQDVFEPYYAGRRRFAAPKDKCRAAEAADSEARKPAPQHPLAPFPTETDSTTEH